MHRRRDLGLSVVVVLVAAVLATGLLANPTGAAADDADEVLLVQPNGRWHIRQPGSPDYTFFYRNPGDVALFGDWDGDGFDTPGMYRPSNGFAYLTNDVPPLGGGGDGGVGTLAALVILSVVLVGLLALPVAKGRWWVVPVVVAAAASFFVVFTVEPSESFQGTTTFKLIEVGLNVASYGGVAAIIYGIAAPAKPGSWSYKRNSPGP